MGAHILLEDNDATPRDIEVVGVAADIRLLDLESDPAPCVYVSMSQVPNSNVRFIANNMFWMVRVGELSSAAGRDGAARSAGHGS